MDDVLFFINPKSQEGNAMKLWKKARSHEPSLPAEPYDVTSHDVAALIKKKKPKYIAIAGGDGTINSICQIVASMEHKPILSIIPMGFGNAVSYCLGVETPEKAIKVLKQRKYTLEVDTMHTNIPNHELGIFNISAGFDARIVLNRQTHRYIGIRSYFIAALRSLVDHTEQEITLTIDKNVKLTAKASSLVIANCPVIGQNYIVSPKAKMNDGLLDCTLFSTKFDYITNLRFRGFKHPLYNEMGKVRFKASHIKIEGEPYVQIDGDPVVEKEGVEVFIKPKTLTFLRNERSSINQLYTPYLSK